MAKNKQIKIELMLDGKQFDATIQNSDALVKNLKRAVGGANKSVVDMANVVTGINQAMQIANKVIGVAGKAIDAYANQEKAEKKVEQAVKATGQAAGFSADELKRVASNLQAISTFGDEDILNEVTAQLLTFTNIAGDNFLMAQEAAMDLATLLDGDLKSASIQLGKALNDPVANLSALSRSGIQFSDSQKETIKNLAETNRLAEAQAVILKELNVQYGGQARAAAETVTGQMQQAQNKLGDVLESVGKIIAEFSLPGMKMLGSIADIMVNSLTPASEVTMKAFERQRDEVNRLTADVVPLIDEYDKLKEKTTPSANEQDRLKEIIKQISKEIPTAITQFDELGNAIEISADKARDFIEMQKAILQVKNRDALKAQREDLEDINAEITAIQNNLARRDEEGDIFNYVSERVKKAGGDFEFVTKAVKLTNEQIAELQSNLGDLQFEKTGIEGLINQLSGGDIEAPGKGKPGGGKGGGKKEKEEKGKSAILMEIEAEMAARFALQDAMISMDEISAELFEEDMARLLEINEIKSTYFEEERARREAEVFEAQMAMQDMFGLEDMLLQKKAESVMLEDAMRAKTTAAEFEMLAKEKKLTDERIKLIEKERDARREQVKNELMGIMQMYDAHESYGRQLERMVKQRVKNSIAAYIADSIAKQMDWVIKTVPWPFNLVVAPAAGLAVGALMESIIPSFAKGVKNFGGGVALVGEQGPELVNLPRGSDVITNKRTEELLTKSLLAWAMPFGLGAPLGVSVIENLDARIIGLEKSIKTFAGANAFAKGVKNFSGGVALVGEQGPELVIPNRSTVEIIERARSSAAAYGDNGDVVRAINLLGDRLERVEKKISFDYERFDENYVNFKNRNSNLGRG